MTRRDPKLARTAARAAETARQARLNAVVREHGTEAEQAALLFSALTTGGVKLTALAAAAEGGPPVEFGSPDPDLLARLTRRVERRAKLRLPKAECAADPPTSYCTCLQRALDQPGDEGKRAVLKLAAGFHKRKKTEPSTPAPRETPAEPPQANEKAQDPPARPEPTPKARPARVVHRSRRWHDDVIPFSEMKF
jgi:hypothetical protein